MVCNIENYFRYLEWNVAYKGELLVWAFQGNKTNSCV